MNKRIVLSVVIGLLLGSCAPKASQVTPTTAPRTITIWSIWTGINLAELNRNLDQYRQTHPGITINVVYKKGMKSELDSTIPAGSGPDIIQWANDFIGPLQNKGFLVDLDSLGVTASWLSSIYEPVAAQGVQYKGRIWAIPFTQEGIALVYNKNLLTGAYLPTDALDFSALRSKAESFKMATGKPLICNEGFDGGSPYAVAPIFFGFGLPAFVDNAGRAYLNEPTAINAAEWLAGIRPSLSSATQDYAFCMNNLLAGNIGMWWTGPWVLPDLDKAGFQYGIVGMGKPFVGIQSFMITSNARTRGNAKAALEIAEYLTNSESSKSLALSLKTIPANSAALNDPAVQDLPSISGFGQAIKIGIPMSPSPLSDCQWGPVDNAVAEIWKGSNITQSLNKAQSSLQTCLDNTASK